MRVELQSGESQEHLLRRFRRAVQRSRILSKARQKRWYTPPSEEKRIRLRKSIRRARRRRAREQR
jgi:small subunit ribosomal protein S21